MTWRCAVVAGGRLHGGAVQGQPGRGLPPPGRRQGRGRAVDAVRRRRVQPLRDRLPAPRLLLPRRRRPAVPAPMVHPRRRGTHPPHRRAVSRYPILTRALFRAAAPLQVELCGHATLASAHFLFTSVLAEHETLVEFATKSGVLTAKKVAAPASAAVAGEGKLFIELDFPMIDLVDCHPAELPSIPETLNGASVVSVHKSATAGDLIVIPLLLTSVAPCFNV